MKEKFETKNIIREGEEYTDFLNPKLFREIENKKKVAFILANSDINQSIIIKSERLSNKNFYHNFWHQLWTAESAIRIANAQWLSRKEINTLALVWLFHDAWHGWIENPNDEEMAYIEMENRITDDEMKKLWCTRTDIKRLILATKFSLRGQSDDVLERIIQDADLGAMWYGPHYMLYAAMWLMDELNIDIDKYIHKEKEFIDFLETIHPGIYLSDWAKKIFTNPRDNINIIAQRPEDALLYAYNQRYQNITFEFFSKNINQIIYGTEKNE